MHNDLMYAFDDRNTNADLFTAQQKYSLLFFSHILDLIGVFAKLQVT